MCGGSPAAGTSSSFRSLPDNEFETHNRRAPVLPAAQSDPQDARIRRVCRGAVRAVLRRDGGSPEPAPGHVHPAAADLIGYFEGIDSERRIAWRTPDSLA